MGVGVHSTNLPKTDARVYFSGWTAVTLGAPDVVPSQEVTLRAPEQGLRPEK